MPASVAVLAIDAATPDLVRNWVADGRLPNLAAAMGRGLTGSISGVTGYYIGSTWPSFTTGLNPAGHGFHRIVQLRDRTYDFFRPLDERDGVGGTPFWRLASDAGLRVAVLDVPLSQPESTINGLQITEWGGHDSVFGFRTTPSELASEVLRTVGPYPVPPNCDEHRQTVDEFEAFVSGLELAVEKKTRLTLDVLAREQWDLFVQVFTESHCVGHQCWHLHDRSHPAHNAEARREIGDPLERVYGAIDRGVGQILDRLDDSIVLLVSAHGMSYYRGAGFLLPEILYRLGVTTRQETQAPATLAGRVRSAARPLWKRLPERLRAAVRGSAATTGPGSLPGGRLPELRVDVERSRCFPIANGQPVGGIRLNLRGREPQGILAAGDEADAFCERLTSDLLEIIDERTGEPLVTNVHRTGDLYHGGRLGALPDLLVEWNDSVATGTTAHGGGRGATIGATSPKIGTVEGVNTYVRTGDHVPSGWFALAGVGVSPGSLAAPVSLMDFHPSLCRLLGLPDQEGDGRVIPAFDAGRR